MKRILFLLLCITVGLTVNAKEVTRQQALQKAQLFMKGKQLMTSPNAARGKAVFSTDSLRRGYYVFNTVNQKGFVIVAGDDRMPEILGYSDKGSLDPETAPCNVKWLLNYYNKVAANINEHGAKVRAVMKASKPAIRPLITTTWDQDAPYNDMCPEYNGGRCITGCVATAMAQVINYNRWPVEQTSSVPAYTTGSYQIEVPALEPTQFDWDNMTNADVARLMRYCGQSVQMDYGINESGAMPSDETPALTKVFGYSQTTHYAEHDFYSDEDWEDLLYNELAEQRPIVYNGWGTGGGHTFVIHGYKDGRFYINWGWSGNEDGYFSLTGLNTGIGDFNDTQSATIGIQPPAGNDVSRPVVVVKSINFYGGEKYFFRNESGVFTLYANGTLVSDLAEQKTLCIGLGLFDEEGLKKVLWEEKHDFPMGEEYWFNISFEIPSDVANGEYRIVPICRNNDSDNWKTDANSSDYYLGAAIADKYMKVQAYPLNSMERNTDDYGVQTIDGITYNVYRYKGQNQASVLPKEEGFYAGDLYVPNKVNWQGTDYIVCKADYSSFQNCGGLTSLSVGMRISPSIWSCSQLSKIELREGVVEVSSIGGCDLLESIEYPQSASFIEGAISNCVNLKTIRFKNPNQFVFGGNPYWDDNSLPNLTDIYFTSPDAPTIRWKDEDMAIHSTATIHVPQGFKADYENGEWNGWKIVDDLRMPEVNNVEWGYCDGNAVAIGSGVYDQVGGNNGEYAIHVPSAMLEAYKGKTISEIQVFMSAEYDYVFITTPGKDYLVRQPMEGTHETWEHVILSEPYTITGEELFVGFGHKGVISTAFADENTIEKDGLWFRAMGTDDSLYEPGEWVCVPKQNPAFAHPIPLRFVISGGDLPADAVLRDVSITPVSKNKYAVKAKVVNRLTSQLKNVKLNWDFDGTNKGDKTFELDVRPGHSEVLSFDVEATLTNRNNNFNYTITKVNDQTDEIAANSTDTLNFNTAANTLYPRTVVMEEATGTWCGWCVRGIETIERLTKQYPDNFIAIGLHNGDEMANFVNYGPIAMKFSQYPSCIINRTKLMDPDLPNIQPLVEEVKDKAEAKVSATAVYAKRDHSAVTVNTESMFGFSDDKTANFRLSYALVEDKVGPYVQNNYYSGMTLDADAEYMTEWTKKDAKVKWTFNDVARGLFGGVDGVEGSVPKIIKEGETYKYAYTFILPDNVSKRENLRIVVMLIDNSSGEIVNACQTAIQYDPSVENQVFSLTNNGESVLDGETVSYGAEISQSGVIGKCGTNVETSKAGLVVKTYDAKQFEGTAKLEILSNSIAAQTLTWSMGGTAESIIGKTIVEKSFKTNSNGELKVGLVADKMQSYGQLEARLTVTIGNQTESVNIVLLNEKPVVGNVTVSNDQVWWSNYDTREGTEYGGLGSGVAERTMAAVYIPFDMLGGKGTTIDGFNFRSSGSSMVNVAVWVATKLPDNDDTVDLEMIRIPAKQLKEFEWHEIAFSQSYEIPESGLYVGYSFDITDPNAPGGNYPLEYSNSDANRKGGMWVKSDSNPKWSDLGLKYGNLLAKVLFGGGTFTRHAISTSDIAPVAALKGSSGKARMRLVSEGADTVNELTIEINGENGSSATSIISASIEPFAEAVVEFDINADEVSGADLKTITISKINGQDNVSEKKSGTVRLFTLQNRPVYKPVFETVSSTKLWGSIRDPFISKELAKTFGDKIVQIYPHVDDIMTIDDYSDVTDTLHILNTYVNRGEMVDSYYGTNTEQWGIKEVVKRAMNIVAPGSISVSAEWMDDNKEVLDIRAESLFEMTFDNNPFLMGFVLVEDGLHGTGSNWNQANQYAGLDMGDEPFFSELAALPSWVPGLKFDNIPVAAWGAYKGVAGSLPVNIVANEKNPYAFSIDVSDYNLIQDKENLTVVALLLDKNTGKIFNAAKFRLGEGSIDPDPDNPDPQEDNVFEFRYVNKSLENNETVVISAAEDSFGFGELECLTNPTSNPRNGLILVTKDGSKQSGSATITILNNTLNPKMVQWCMGGECVPMNNKTTLTKDFTTDDEGICLVMFDATDIRSEGELNAKLTATVGNDTKTVNIRFIYNQADGLSIIYSDGDAVWYDMNGTRLNAAPTRKGVYIRNGKKVVR